MSTISILDVQLDQNVITKLSIIQDKIFHKCKDLNLEPTKSKINKIPFLQMDNDDPIDINKMLNKDLLLSPYIPFEITFHDFHLSTTEIKLGMTFCNNVKTIFIQDFFAPFIDSHQPKVAKTFTLIKTVNPPTEITDFLKTVQNVPLVFSAIHKNLTLKFIQDGNLSTSYQPEWNSGHLSFISFTDYFYLDCKLVELRNKKAKQLSRSVIAPSTSRVTMTDADTKKQLFDSSVPRKSPPRYHSDLDDIQNSLQMVKDKSLTQTSTKPSELEKTHTKTDNSSDDDNNEDKEDDKTIIEDK